MFQPGTYFVGDLGFALPPNALRVVFGEILKEGKVIEGYRTLGGTDSGHWRDFNEQLYWITPLPHKEGTIFDQNGKAYGFDWCVFGCIQFSQVHYQESFEENKIEFVKPFECSRTHDGITIGHLHFTIQPPSQ